jgi:hypothetical protein
MKAEMTKTTLNRVSSFLTNVLSLDLRSLAMFRIGFGLIILVDLINRARYLHAHYTDLGLVPRWALLKNAQSDYYFSLHLLSGEPYLISLLFIIAAVLAVFLILGFNTRVSTLLSWLMLLSLQNRNPLVLDGGDVALRMFLLIAVFLPTGARYSIDATRATVKNNNHSICSLASFALIYQLFLIYFFAAFFKTDPIWTEKFTAVFFAFSLEAFSTSFALYLMQYHELLEWMTWASHRLEYYGMLLLLVPIFNRYFRLLCVLSFVGFHLGLAATLELGIFPYLMCFVWVSLTPGFVWDFLGKYVHFKRFKTFYLEKFYPRFMAVVPDCLIQRTPDIHGVINTPTRLLLTLGLVYITLWNIRGVSFAELERYFPMRHNWIADSLRLDQSWKLFAPYPTRRDGWYVIDAELANGDRIDLWKHYWSEVSEVSFEKPPVVSKSYINQRWRKYMLNYRHKSNDRFKVFFAQYLCRNWNKEHFGDDALNTFEIFFMLETTLHNYETPRIVKEFVWGYDCNANAPVPESTVAKSTETKSTALKSKVRKSNQKN